MSGRVKIDAASIFGLTGELPTLSARADFIPDDLGGLIDTHGSRFAWARAIRCPCQGLNTQTALPDPRCARCRNHPGWTFYGPDFYNPGPQVGLLDELQTALVAQYGASVIRGVMMGNYKNSEPYTTIGPWEFGKGMVTVRPENILATYDRLVDLDSRIVFSEVLVTGPAASTEVPAITTKYPVVEFCHALDQNGVQYRLGNQLRLDPRGELSWVAGRAPAAKTRVAFAYLCHAHYRVMGQPHAMRRSQPLLRPSGPEITPLGNPTDLPIQAMVQLDFLTEEPS